jgi:hypothetical protein
MLVVRILLVRCQAEEDMVLMVILVLELIMDSKIMAMVLFLETFKILIN